MTGKTRCIGGKDDLAPEKEKNDLAQNLIKKNHDLAPERKK